MWAPIGEIIFYAVTSGLLVTSWLIGDQLNGVGWSISTMAFFYLAYPWLVPRLQRLWLRLLGLLQAISVTQCAYAFCLRVCVAVHFVGVAVSPHLPPVWVLPQHLHSKRWRL